jgi:hypothetical protein
MRTRDEAYLQWLRTQDCAQCGKRPSDAHHHTGKRGIGQKSDDKWSFPLCRTCHSAFHDHKGPFKDWSREGRRGWQTLQSKWWRGLYKDHKGELRASEKDLDEVF